MQHINTVYIIIQREMIRLLRDVPRVVMTTIQPILFLLIFGAGIQVSIKDALGVDYIKFIYPGIIAFTVVTTAFFSTVTTVRDRELGFLKEIFISPVSRTAVLIGKGIASSILATLQALLILFFLPFAGLKFSLSFMPELLLFMFLLSFAIAGLGLFISALVKSPEDFAAITPIVIFPFFYMSGTFFPLTQIPLWMLYVDAINPVAYGVEGMRLVVLEGQIPQDTLDGLVLNPNTVNAAFLILFAAFMFTLASIIFNKKG